MKRFDSEKELQTYCLAVLRSKGIHAQEEVWCGGIRADIVTSDWVMELKKVLDREGIYQALGQAVAYQRTLNRKQIWIVGQTPTNSAERTTAQNVAAAVATDSIRISFIETDRFWQVKPIANWWRWSWQWPQFSTRNLDAGGLALAALWAIVALIGVYRIVQYSQPIPQPNRSVLLNSSVEDSKTAQQTISGCGVGVLIPFRQNPDAETDILLNSDETIRLTGRIAQNDAGTWHEAIVPRVSMSPGWVASCGVKAR